MFSAPVTNACTVGAGKAVHAFTSWTAESGKTYENTECGAVTWNGAAAGKRPKILPGEHVITCKRCLSVLSVTARM